MKLSKLYSHPDKLLKDHLCNVYQLGMKKFKNKKLNFTNINKIELVTKIVLISHDFGKANSFFQRKLELASKGKTECEEYKKLTKQGKNKSNHSLLSSMFTYYLLNKLLEDSLFVLLGMILVYRHHGNIKNFNDMVTISKKDWQLLDEQANTIEFEKLNKILEGIGIDAKVDGFNISQIKNNLTGWKFDLKLDELKQKFTTENYLIFNLIFSILISSDKAEAIFYSKDLSYEKLEELVLCRRKIDPEVVDKYKKIKGWNQSENKMDQQRNQIYDETLEKIDQIDLEKDRILSINVPTGTGKTLTALAAALKLREKVGQSYRLIYTLPFTSIIDQNFAVFSNVFSKANIKVDSSLLIKHHYLTPKSYVKENYEDEEYDISKHLIESWNSEIIVTTFVQLLHSIFSNQNRSLLKFYNISNSIILLDEVQNIPHKYWKLVKVMLKLIGNKLDCYFIFITATMPLIYSEEKGEIEELATNKENYFEFFDRIDLDLSEFRQEKTLSEFKNFITSDLEKYNDKNCLIILNTIKTSIELYKHVNKLVEDEVIEAEVLYLSTNIVPNAREKRIEQIGDSNERQIIVSTQMVEAGVDIDLDRVYRDFAPLDSINQTCGRCNRNFNPNKRGVVTIVKLINEDHNDKSYASYVYGDILLRSTEKLLSQLPDLVEEKDFFEMNKDYFEKVASVKSDDASINLLDKIKELKYEKAFWRDEADNGEVFKLIEQDFETVNLFVELNEKAYQVWDKYKTINEMEISSIEDYSRRKSEFEKIKKEFLSYVITIPKYVAKDQLNEVELEETFNRIDEWQRESVYDIETGFKRGVNELDTFC
jgi:CRISPR-associated endonuclease/helicase Cas3